FDQDLARLTVELLDRRLDLRPVARERRDDDRVRGLVGDEPDLALEDAQLTDADAAAGECGPGRRRRRRGRRRRRAGRALCRGLSSCAGRCLAGAVDRVEGSRQVLRLAALGVVVEAAAATVEIDVELLGS